MMKKSLMLCFTLLVVGCFTFAMGKTFTGTVSDSNCGAKHAKAGDDAAACVAKCVSGGAKYVLVSGGTVYQLDAQDKFADFAGKSVKVTGTAKGDSITVASVEAAAAKKAKSKM